MLFSQNNSIPADTLSNQFSKTSGAMLLSAQFEENCWRCYLDPNNALQQIRPRLYTVTSDGNNEDRWFFEYDSGNEPPSQLIEKCLQYEAYYDSGTEQRDGGVFPTVVWIIPDEERRIAIRSRFAQSEELRHKELFRFISPDELETLIRNGAGEGVMIQ